MALDKYIQLADISGHHYTNDLIKMHKDDFYTLCMKNPNDNIGLRKKGMIIFKQKDTTIEYLYSDFVRFCLSIYKNNQHNDGGNMQMIPKSPIPMSQELQDYIREFLPDYFETRNSVK